MSDPCAQIIRHFEQQFLLLADLARIARMNCTDCDLELFEHVAVHYASTAKAALSFSEQGFDIERIVEILERA